VRGLLGQSANQAFTTLRDGDDHMRGRQTALAALTKAYQTYVELQTRLKDGLGVRLTPAPPNTHTHTCVAPKHIICARRSS
jgi:hypothetical protein